MCGEPGDNRRCLDIDQTILATLFARADCWNSQAGLVTCFDLLERAAASPGRRPKSPALREPFDAQINYREGTSTNTKRNMVRGAAPSLGEAWVVPASAKPARRATPREATLSGSISTSISVTPSVSNA